MDIIEHYNKNAIKLYMTNYNRCYIYGAGKKAEQIFKEFITLEINVNGFIVTERNGNPVKFHNLPVIIVDEFNDTAESVVVIGVSDKYINEVLSELKGREINNVLRIKDGVEIWKVNRLLPKLEITAQIGCKIQCKYCPQDILIKSYFSDNRNRKREISFDDYKTCISNMPKETIISFAGFVEPFFHPKAIDMIMYAHTQGHEIELFTTFMGLSQKGFDLIKDIPFKQVVLHTPDIHRFANIKIDDEYIHILENALNIRKEDGRPFIDSANCQSEPSEEFLKIVKGRLSVESILNDRAGLMNYDNLKRCDLKKGKIICNRSKNFNHWVLLPDGTVVLCCMDFGLSRPLGNLIKSTYNEIIEDVYYKRVILDAELINERDLICRRCTSSMELLK